MTAVSGPRIGGERSARLVRGSLFWFDGKELAHQMAKRAHLAQRPNSLGADIMAIGDVEAQYGADVCQIALCSFSPANA